MDWLSTIAERKIREAMEEGVFDDSPMNIDDDQERRRVALEINDRVLRLNLLWKRSFSHTIHPFMSLET